MANASHSVVILLTMNCGFRAHTKACSKIMDAVIEVRGGKVYAVSNTDSTLISQKRFLAGDKVRIAGQQITLLERNPLAAYAIVTNVVNGRVYLSFPQYTHFESCIVCHRPVCVGARLVVYLTADGSIHPYHVFSPNACDDAKLIYQLYNTIPGLLEYCAPTRGPHYYSCDSVDQTHLLTCTIDPVSSTDLDDAISIDPETQTLYVHIVNIAAFLAPELEKSMFHYVSTLYLANEATSHLLPEHVLRTASLDPGVRRSVITVEMKLMEDGSVGNYRVYPATIVSKNRYSYDTVPLESPQFKWLIDRMRAQETCLPLEIPGLDILCDTFGNPVRIAQVYSNDIAHRLVAYAMIMANYTVSAHLSKKGVTLPNRFHQSPHGATSRDLLHVTGNPIVDSFISVKKWNKAQYDLEHTGHFGLGLSEYVHFTSPMRRYADVIVHMLLAGACYDATWLQKAIEYMNIRAGFVRQCHVLYRQLKVARYVCTLEKKPAVYITSVAAAGVQWYMPDLLLNGFTHVSKIGIGMRWNYKDATLTCHHESIFVGSIKIIRNLEYCMKTNIFLLQL
jgi:hypothetical protein